MDHRETGIELSACGWSTDGQAGNELLENFSLLNRLPFNSESLGSDIQFQCGADHTVVVSQSGQLAYTWGNSEYGQCASGQPQNQVAIPQSILRSWLDKHRITQVSVGASSTLFELQNIESQNRVYLYYGVESPDGTEVAANQWGSNGNHLKLVSKSSSHSLAAFTEDTLFQGRMAWAPTFQTSCADEVICGVACGTHFTLVLTRT
jgi:alpha-tubulin suppressor-like RCC1 family protein